jgi:hypothetical protein
MWLPIQTPSLATLITRQYHFRSPVSKYSVYLITEIFLDSYYLLARGTTTPLPATESIAYRYFVTTRYISQDGVWTFNTTNVHANMFPWVNSFQHIIRIIKSSRIKLATDVACMQQKRHAYSGSVGNLEIKIPLWRPWRRWENNTKMDLTEAGCLVWTWVIWLRIRASTNSCEHSNEAPGSKICWEIFEELSESCLLKRSVPRS